MKIILKRTVLMVAVVALAIPAFSDTLILRNGDRISGYYEGGTSRVIRFRTDDGVQDYDLLTVQELRFGGDTVSSEPQVSSRTAARAAEEPRLRQPNEPQPRPVTANAADTAWTVPRGSTLLIRLDDDIDSEVDRVGQVFRATLAEPLQVDGIEVAPEGSQVRGRIARVESAGRVRGSAELRLQLERIVVNGVPYPVATAEYAEVAEGRGGETARRVGTGAGIGAIIGAIAGGGQGAAIGAGVGAGAAGTVQVLTKGEELYIPAETLLGFTLSEPLIIAAR